MKINIGKNPVMFGSSDCKACLMQIKLLMDYFGDRDVSIAYYDLSKYPAPDFLKKNGSVSMPTWVFPNGSTSGLIMDKKKFNSLLMKRKTAFGSCLNNIDSLAKCGKNFPDNKSFEIPTSYMQSVQSKWGKGDDTLNAGIGGTRSLGPNKIGEFLSNNYFNDIRMAHPSDQLGTSLFMNRNCNQSSSFKSPGLIYDSKNPQVVGFGRKTRFGPAYNKGYLMKKDTVRDYFGGGIQNNLPRPNKVKGDTYISTYPEYKFGKVGEGSVLSIRKNKIKVS